MIGRIQQGLVGLLTICLVVRIGSWLIEPALPALVALLLLVTILSVITNGRLRR